jgi:tripartite-type tricarboxylate transporter receptor subunit TctC
MRNTASLAAYLLAAAIAAPAAAQDVWPSKLVRLIVTSSPGGGTDTFARLMAQSLTQQLKSQFVVENRAGASGNIGAEMVARAAPDGYTVLVSSSPSLIINPSLYKNLPYNAERDFAPVAQGVISPLIWVVHPSLSVRTLGELVAAGKQNPGKVPYGSAGAGSLTNLGVLLFAEIAGVSYLHVPYKGLGQAYPGLLAGDIKFVLSDVGTALPHVRAGKVHAIAVTERIKQLPGVPSVADAGFGNSVAQGTFSVAATAGTPGVIISRLSAEILRAMKAPDVAAKLEDQVLIPVFDTPEAFAAVLRNERARWAAFIQRNGIVPE